MPPLSQAPPSRSFTVGVIGAGVAGATVALRLSEQGVPVVLMEAGESLVNGPPMCHLHVGGCLYREIPDSHCVELLKQGIDTIRMFPHTINYRPTVLIVPESDPGSPDSIVPRLELLERTYRDLITVDPRNKVLGEPEEYFKVYEREEFIALAHQAKEQHRGGRVLPRSHDDWVRPVARYVLSGSIKFPVICVQEFGWSILRMAATLDLALRSRIPHIDICLNTRVTSITQSSDRISHVDGSSANADWLIHHVDMITGEPGETRVSYVVNACGFQTGTIDDMVGVKVKRMVEFKAAYLTKWSGEGYHWPEVIFHGTRGTPNGMAQLTPNGCDVYQLHGMTKNITLFGDGLCESSGTKGTSSQPRLPSQHLQKIASGWEREEIEERTVRSINHVAQFLPVFGDATVAGKPLFGAQQIPGRDVSLRVGGAVFPGPRYARIEIVKGSSAPAAADALLAELVSRDYVQLVGKGSGSREKEFPSLSALTWERVLERAKEIAIERELPLGLIYPGHFEV